MKLKNVMFLMLVPVFMLTVVSFQGMLWKEITKEELKTGVKKIDQKMKDLTNYEVRITHYSYEDRTSEVIHDKSKGYYKRDQKKYHSMMLGVETIQNENIRLEIDSVKKLILVANPDASLQRQPSTELKDSMITKSIAVKKMELPKELSYEIDFAENFPVAYCRISTWESGYLKDVILAYTRKVKSVQNKEVQPKVKISFSDWKANKIFSADEFSESRYVKKAGKAYELTPAYKNYKLLDQRYYK
ncbi:MAG TPA: hypothetical protein VNZ86_03800 [Bacteroidia bacterium]|jgi:hypothetical protein|nr:hypothetical protein [Bacteroidia bacterium]